MNLREIACQKLTEEVLGACEKEYRAMYHNASIRGYWPDFDTQEEESRFWDWAGESFGFLLEDLEADLKEQFGFEWKLCAHGRGGATVAPDGFALYSTLHGFSQHLDTEKIVCPDDYQDPETYSDDDCGDSWVGALKTAQEYLAAFKLINEVVRACAAADLCKWWEEQKAANEWTLEDESEDNEEEEAA